MLQNSVKYSIVNAKKSNKSNDFKLVHTIDNVLVIFSTVNN